LAAPYITKGLQALSSIEGIKSLQNALMREASLPPREKSPVEGVLADPAAQEAVAAQQEAAKKSWANWLAGTVATGAEGRPAPA
jgi:hypothetical protein